VLEAQFAVRLSPYRGVAAVSGHDYGVGGFRRYRVHEVHASCGHTQFVGQSAYAQRCRRVCAVGEVTYRRRVVENADGAVCLAVVDLGSSDSADGRRGAGEYHGGSGGGVDRSAVVGVEQHKAFASQAVESALAEAALQKFQIVVVKTVDHYADDKTRLRRRLSGREGHRHHRGQKSQDDAGHLGAAGGCGHYLFCCVIACFVVKLSRSAGRMWPNATFP
jgi:hypothetical protein